MGSSIYHPVSIELVVLEASCQAWDMRQSTWLLGLHHLHGRGLAQCTITYHGSWQYDGVWCYRRQFQTRVRFLLEKQECVVRLVVRRKHELLITTLPTSCSQMFAPAHIGSLEVLSTVVQVLS
jgi:hypothetical protein